MNKGLTMRSERPGSRAFSGPVRAPFGRLFVGLCAALILSACAGLQEVRSTVSSYGNWPEGRQPGAYVFERLPSQQSQPQEQAMLEAAAEPALATAGFRKVDDAKQADVTVQVAAQALVQHRQRYDPWYPYGPYNPYFGPWRPGFGGWWGSGGRGGISISMAMEPPYVQMQVDVLIRDRRNNQVLYETHAAHEHVGSPIDALYPFLFEAALKDFPRQAVSPRTVTIPVPAQQR